MHRMKLGISIIVLYGFFTRIVTSEFCTDFRIDAAVTLRDLCNQCMYIFSHDYVYISSNNGTLLDSGRKIHSVWSDIETPIDAVLRVTIDYEERLMFIKGVKWWSAKTSGPVLSSGSINDWHWPNGQVFGVPSEYRMNKLMYRVVYSNGKDIMSHTCVSRKGSQFAFDCTKTEEVLRVTNPHNGIIEWINLHNDPFLQQNTKPLTQHIQLNAIADYTKNDETIWYLFGEKQHCMVNWKNYVCKLNDNSKWFKCMPPIVIPTKTTENTGNSEDENENSESDSKESKLKMSFIIIGGLIASLIVIFVIFTLLTSLCSKRNKKSLHWDKESDLSDSSYGNVTIQASEPFIYSGKTIDKPIPINFQRQMSDSELDLNNPTELEFKSKVEAYIHKKDNKKDKKDNKKSKGSDRYNLIISNSELAHNAPTDLKI